MEWLMRIKWILGVVFALSSVAMGSPNVSFQVVIQGGDSVATDGGQPSGDFYGNTDQVVVGQGGSVGINATTQNNGTAVILYQAAGSNVVQTIATGGDTIGSSGPLDTFDNVAISPNGGSATRVTFAAEDSLTSSLGVFQQDVGVTSTQTVAYGNTGSVRLDSSDQPDAGLVPLQVNSSGQAIFSGTNGSGTPSIFLGNLASTATLFAQGGGTTITQPGNRLGIYAATANPTVGAALLTNNSVNSVYSVVGGTATNQGSSFHTPQTLLLGVGNYGLGNAALMYSQTNTTASIVLHDDGITHPANGTDYVLGTFDGTAVPPPTVAGDDAGRADRFLSAKCHGWIAGLLQRGDDAHGRGDDGGARQRHDRGK